MLLLSWGVVAAAELRCPAAAMVMDMRLPSSWYQTVSAVLSRVGVEDCVYIPSRLTCWYQALNLGPLQHCDFSRWCKWLTQAHADTHDGWRQHGDTDSLLPGAPGCLLSDAPDSLPAECNKASSLYSQRAFHENTTADSWPASFQCGLTWISGPRTCK